MKKLLFIIILFFGFSTLSQNSDIDLKLQILKGIFKTNEIKQFEGQKVFETKVWEKHATIPIDNCHPVIVDEGVAAMAFEIFLSEDPNDYENMISGGINGLFEGEGFQGGDQRLLQVIYYDIDNDRFLGKGKGFPLKSYPWIQDNLGSWSDLTLIIDFSYNTVSPYTCMLILHESLENLEGLGGMHYVFKYHKGKVLTSSGINGCFESIYTKNNSLIMKMITNCEDHHFDGAEKKIKEYQLFKW